MEDQRGDRFIFGLIIVIIFIVFCLMGYNIYQYSKSGYKTYSVSNAFWNSDISVDGSVLQNIQTLSGQTFTLDDISKLVNTDGKLTLSLYYSLGTETNVDFTLNASPGSILSCVAFGKTLPVNNGTTINQNVSIDVDVSSVPIIITFDPSKLDLLSNISLMGSTKDYSSTVMLILSCITMIVCFFVIIIFTIKFFNVDYKTKFDSFKKYLSKSINKISVKGRLEKLGGNIEELNKKISINTTDHDLGKKIQKLKDSFDATKIQFEEENSAFEEAYAKNRITSDVDDAKFQKRNILVRLLDDLSNKYEFLKKDFETFVKQRREKELNFYASKYNEQLSKENKSNLEKNSDLEIKSFPKKINISDDIELQNVEDFSNIKNNSEESVIYDIEKETTLTKLKKYLKQKKDSNLEKNISKLEEIIKLKKEELIPLETYIRQNYKSCIEARNNYIESPSDELKNIIDEKCKDVDSKLEEKKSIDNFIEDLEIKIAAFDTEKNLQSSCSIQ